MRIGTLGTARITRTALLEPASIVDGVEVVAVAARDEQRARAYASEHNISTVHRSYGELIADDSLDAVYIPLPASEHGPWSCRALEAGRHVLVEKPFALNASQATTMVETARASERVLLEAFHWRYHPLATRMIEVAGLLGPLRRARAVFNVEIPNTADIRYDLSLGGGALMDLGCYPLHWLRTLAGSEPTVERARADQGPPGVDVTLEATLAFSSGLVAELGCSMRYPTGHPECQLVLQGEHGTMRVDNPIWPQGGHRLTAELADGTTFDEQLDRKSTYAYQLEAFRRMVEDDAEPLTGYEDAIANMAAIDAAYRAAGLMPR